MKRVLFVSMAFVLLVSCASSKIEVRSKGVVINGNTVVHYLEAGQGPELILVHGIGSSAEAWRESMMILAKSYRVIVPDLPGYGKSDKPKASYSVEYYAKVLNDFITSLGLKKAAIAGNSLGGWIALLFALDHPEKVSHLVLVASAGLKRDTLPAINLNPSTKEEQKALLFGLFADPGMVTDRMLAEQWEYRKAVRATVQSTLESFKTHAPFLDERVKSLKMPTLIIWGRQDRIIPLEFGERFHKAIRGSKLVVLDNTGHMPQLERPKEFARAVKGFVRSW